MKAFGGGLVLKQRQKVIRKWAILGKNSQEKEKGKDQRTFQEIRRGSTHILFIHLVIFARCSVALLFNNTVQ